MREWIAKTSLSLFESMYPALGILILATFIILIPLGLFDKTRGFSAVALLIASYIFGFCGLGLFGSNCIWRFRVVLADCWHFLSRNRCNWNSNFWCICWWLSRPCPVDYYLHTICLYTSKNFRIFG